jgi:hypothetical protein
VEEHAGKVLGEQMTKFTSEWKAEIAQERNISNARGYEMVDRIHRAHSKPGMQRWGAMALVSSLLLIGSGILIGTYVREWEIAESSPARDFLPTQQIRVGLKCTI